MIYRYLFNEALQLISQSLAGLRFLSSRRIHGPFQSEGSLEAGGIGGENTSMATSLRWVSTDDVVRTLLLNHEE